MSYPLCYSPRMTNELALPPSNTTNLTTAPATAGMGCAVSNRIHGARMRGGRWNVAEKIQDSGLGRDIRKKELERFINQDVVVV